MRFKRPGSPYYYCDFDLDGKNPRLIHSLQKERNAIDYPAAYRLRLVKGDVGLAEPDKPLVPTFKPTFSIVLPGSRLSLRTAKTVTTC